MEAHAKVWKPILTGPDAQRVAALLESIATTLADRMERDVMRPELARGAAGVAMFFGYLLKTFGETRWTREAVRALRTAFATPIQEAALPSFMHGRTGIVWVAQHLGGEIDTPHLGELTQETASLLRDRLRSSPLPEGYELFKGLIGYARFGLDRLDSSTGRQVAEGAIAKLLDCAEPTDGGITWWTGEKDAERHVRLGVAHGVPGAIAILAEAYRLGLMSPAQRPVLDGAVRWLFAQKNPENAMSRFGTLILAQPDGIDHTKTRIAWCWGDLGIAAALRGAAVNVGEQDCWWAEEVLDLAHFAAQRPMENAGVVEAGLCHGATGVGHMFNRLYQNTGDEIFLTAARQWFDRAIEYSTIQVDDASLAEGGEPLHVWPIKPGLLTGLAGVGLALLAAVSDVEPDWDRALLIAIPPRTAVHISE